MSGRGAHAESLAADFLTRRGLTILDRNWRCRFGEIDLVVRDGEMLVFVEVRARSSEAFGGAAASIDRAKQRRLVAAANAYLAVRRDESPCRFDALLVGRRDEVEWLRDAFRAG